MDHTALVNWVALSLIIAFKNPWYGMYYFIKAVATARVNINNIGIKITPLLNLSIITSNIFAPDFILGGRSIIKSINISYQIH